MLRRAILIISSLLLVASVADANTKQRHVAAWSSQAGNTTYYTPVFTTGIQTIVSTTESETQETIPVAGTIRNFKIRAGTALTGAQTLTFTLRLNGSGTSISITLNAGSGTTAQTDSDSVSISANDEVSFERTATNTPGAITVHYSFEWEASAAKTTIHGWGGAEDNQTTVTEQDGIFGGGGSWGSLANTADMVATPGTVTQTCAWLSVAPGAGKTRVFAIFKNGTIQDGAGGTVDTRLTISDTATSGCQTFSLTIARTDQIAMRSSQTGTAATTFVNGTTVIVNTVDHTWNFGGAPGGTISTVVGTTIYNYPGGNAVWSTTESARQFNGPTTGVWLSGMIGRLNPAPGSGGDTWTVTLRKNGSSTAQSIAFVDSATTAADNDVENFNIATGDVYTLQGVSAVTPAAATSFFTFVATDADPATLTGFNALLIVSEDN